MPHAPAGRGTSRFLSLRPSGCFWTQLSGAERFLPPVLGTLVSPSFRSGAAHTGLGSWGWLLCWGVRGRESLLLSTLLLKLLTQALKTSTSAFSGTSPYPWPLLRSSWKWVMWLRSVLGGGAGRYTGRSCRDCPGQDPWGHPDSLLPLIWLSRCAAGLQPLTPTERQEEGKCRRLRVWDGLSIIKMSSKEREARSGST